MSSRHFSSFLAFLIFVLSCPMLMLASGKHDDDAKDVTEPDAMLSPLPAQKLLQRSSLCELEVKTQSFSPVYHLGNVRGIDVSHYQGVINWQAVRTDSHASYVYIKATENATLVDKCYNANVRGARAAGIPVGSYHFYSPNASPVTQLLNFTRAVPDLRNQDLIPLIDIEVRGKRGIDEFRENLRQFLYGVEQHYGVRPMLYTGTNFYNKYLSGYFDDYIFMIARYSDEPPVLLGNPKFAIWQYSAKGSVLGINHDVDMSVFMNHYTMKDILVR